MVRVAKGELRLKKQLAARLLRAVPTLELRRRQLNREILEWERKKEECERGLAILRESFSINPHKAIDVIVEKDRITKTEINIAGVSLEILDRVFLKPVRYSKLSTPPSFDFFVKIKARLLEEEIRFELLNHALLRLEEELTITTQRINLFEKRLIPECREDIRYIKGRLEDNDRSIVMVAKIAQAMMEN